MYIATELRNLYQYWFQYQYQLGILRNKNMLFKSFNVARRYVGESSRAIRSVSWPPPIKIYLPIRKPMHFLYNITNIDWSWYVDTFNYHWYCHWCQTNTIIGLSLHLNSASWLLLHMHNIMYVPSKILSTNDWRFTISPPNINCTKVPDNAPNTAAYTHLSLFSYTKLIGLQPCTINIQIIDFKLHNKSLLHIHWKTTATGSLLHSLLENYVKDHHHYLIVKIDKFHYVAQWKIGRDSHGIYLPNIKLSLFALSFTYNLSVDSDKDKVIITMDNTSGQWIDCRNNGKFWTYTWLCITPLLTL